MGVPRATGGFRFGDGERWAHWRGYVWAMPAEGGPFAADFFPPGEPGLRRLGEEERASAWSAFRATAARLAADETSCCRRHAEEVERLLASPAKETPR